MALEIGANFPVYLLATSSQNRTDNEQLDQPEQEYSNPGLVTGKSYNRSEIQIEILPPS
jgi:hypothetical protein